MKAYAGIGSRSTPAEMLLLMRDVAHVLGARGWTLRSGAAEGADRAFEDGAWDAATAPYARQKAPKPEVYLPWPSFNEGKRAMLLSRYYVSRPQPQAFEIARKHHPAWDRLSAGGKSLHARNVHQILGPDVTAPALSRFVLCWTPGGEGGGGTGQAIRIAGAYGVPVFDLALDEARERIERFLDTKL
jgi:hypothetical protein